MFLDHTAEWFDDARFRYEKQQRKRAVTVFVILGHEVVDSFVEQPRIGEGAADAAAFFRRAIAQRVVDECRCLIGVDVVKIADGLLAHGRGRVVEQAGYLIERSGWGVATLGEILGGLTKSRDVAHPAFIIVSTCGPFLDLFHQNSVGPGQYHLAVAGWY